MSEEKRIAAIEEELKVLKNEIKTVLLDIREHYLNVQSPFNKFNRVVEEDDDDLECNVKKTNDYAKVETKDTKEKILLVGANNALPAKSPAEEAEGDSMGSSLLDTVLTGVNADYKEKLSDFEEDSDQKNPKESRRKKADLKYPKDNGKVDLVIIAALAKWVKQATAMLGKERVEALVEVSCTMRQFPAEIKDVLIKLVRLSHYDNDNGKMTSAKDYLSILAQLDSLLGSEHQDEALLSILSMMSESNNG